MGEVCEIKPPKREARVKLNIDDLVSFLPMEDLGIGIKFVVPSQEKKLGEVQSSYTYFSEGDVLLAKITPCFENGKLGIAKKLKNGVGFGSSEYVVLRPTKILGEEWLYYFLSQPSFRTEGAARMTGAVGHKRLAKDFVDDYPIPLPPLPEQERIVGILDEAFAGIAAAKERTEKNLQNARDLFQSKLNQVFSQRGEGWVERRLGDIAESISTGPFGSLIHKSDYIRGGIPLVNPINITPDGIVPDQRKTVSVSFAERLKAYKLKTGDIVTARRGEIGRTAVISVAQEGWLCGTGCFFIRFAKAFDPVFFSELLQSKPYKDQLVSVSERATMPSISNKDLMNLLVSIPDVQVQKEVVQEIDGLRKETRRLESLYARKLEALEALKAGLLRKAFAGEL